MRKMFVLQAYVIITFAIAATLQGCGGGQTANVTTPTPVTPPVTIVMTTTTLPSGEADAAYNSPLGATGGSKPYTWKLASGELPPGITLASDGTISGTPTELGTYNFNVQVSDTAQPANSASSPLGLKVDRSRKPTISNVTVSDITPTSAVISWTTDTASDTTAVWGPDLGYGYDTGARDTTNGTKTHTQTITGLLPGTGYYYAVRSRGFTGSKPDDAKASLVFYDVNKKFTTQAAPTTGEFDYYVSAVGPHHVVQGYEVYTLLNIGALAGTQQYPTGVGNAGPNAINVTITGLPPNSTLHFPDQESLKTTGSGQCCSFNPTTATAQLWSPEAVQFEVVTTDQTPAGTYTVHIHTSTTHPGGTPTKDIDWPLTVEPKPSFALAAPSSYPAIPDLATWEANMTTYGAKWCMHEDAPGSGTYSDTKGPCSIGVYSCSWFYDGEKVYEQIADYRRKMFSEDPAKWYACSQASEGFYRDTYVIARNGAVQAINVFPHGLYMDYVRTGDTQSKNAIASLVANAPYSSLMHGTLVDPTLTRETAYRIHADRINFKLGDRTREVKLRQTVAYALGHIDMWTVDKNAVWMQPYMAGLLANALIEYYEDGHQDDLRIPPALKRLADWLWANAWVPDNGNTSFSNAFYYNSYHYKFGFTAAGDNWPDLNLHIAPMYAWLFKMTGDAKYQQWGDAVWSGGAKHASINWNGKIFAENYRWSFDYVKWRTQP